MTWNVLRALMLLVCIIAQASIARGAEESTEGKASYSNPQCLAPVDRYFVEEVWEKVASAKCLTCHKVGGDAEESQLILRDPQKSRGADRDDVLRQNRNAFVRLAIMQEKDQARLLVKVTGGLDHGGSDVLKADSTGYRILQEFVRRTRLPIDEHSLGQPADDKDAPPFFANVQMLDDRRLLRRATLSLAGRLPTPEEQQKIAKAGRQALPSILDVVLREEAFFDRLREGFNDIFLTVGYDDGAESALAYDHFSESRIWYQKYDLSHIADEKERRQAGYKLAGDYRAALFGEPMKLVEYIVRHDRPFTEIVTADYILVSPYTARGYGIFEQLREQFKNPEDPFEYIPVRLKALKGRDRHQDQESATGFYPHAGLLSTFQYLRRYPTTETNRNRLRARMYYQHFLGIDALELAARVSDAAAVSAKYEVPTMQASECVVCHKTLDPVAGIFQDYYKFEGVYGRRKEGWYQDMFVAGFEGEDLPADERWRALPWLGERTAKDPRFASTMVEHVYYILTGRKVLLPPKDLDDPLYAARQRAYRAQRRQVEEIAQQLAADNFNLKTAFKAWVLSDFYRADGLATADQQPERLAELDDIGLVRLLAPEQVERKVEAVFGSGWGRLKEQMAMLYGGIDSQEVTERATDPSGAMGAIQRLLSNDVASLHTLAEFAKPQDQRRLFPGIEADVLPGKSPEDDQAIRVAIVHLHGHILGRDDALDSAEVERTFTLFAGIISDAHAQQSFEKTENYYSRSKVKDPPADPHYTIRAWRGVVTYLLRRPEFLYE